MWERFIFVTFDMYCLSIMRHKKRERGRGRKTEAGVEGVKDYCMCLLVCWLLKDCDKEEVEECCGDDGFYFARRISFLFLLSMMVA